MARQLRWSPEAIEDVESIANYIERDSGYYARAVVSSARNIGWGYYDHIRDIFGEYENETNST